MFSSLAYLAEGYASYCRHLASVVIVYNFSKLFSSDTTWPIGTKLGMNITWGILHRTVVGILDPLKNMATVIKSRTKGSDSSFSQISPKLLGLAKLFP